MAHSTYTIEFHIDGLPTLSHSYPTEAHARAAFHSASTSPSAPHILALRLLRHNQLILSTNPSQLSPPKRPLPPPDSSGVRHIPPSSRALRPSSLYFWSADRPPTVLDPSTILV